MQNIKSQIAVLMGIVILIADLYWTYTSYPETLWLALGSIIFVADIIWLVIDFSFMKGAAPKKPIVDEASAKTARR